MNLARQLARGLRVSARVLQRTSELIYEPPQARRVKPWFAINGDKTLRLDYELGPDSVVLDVGGFEGQWASDIFARYGCSIHILEPVDAFYASMVGRFSRNPKIRVHPCGLASKSGLGKISQNGDASSLVLEQKPGREVKVLSFEDFLRDQGLEHVDLMKINIEGAEYSLLESMLDRGLVSKVTDLQVQFHDFVENAPDRMRAIQRRLSSTHHQTYAFEFVWENWRLRREPRNEPAA